MLKFIYKFIAIVLVATLICPAPALAARHRRIPPKTTEATMTANSAILIDFDHNRRYFGKDIDKPIFPASTTKLLTAILVLEKLPLDQYVTVSERATQVQPTKLDLRAGEQYKVRDLMYGLLLKSANDAAIVLAEAVGGTQENFVKMMNDKAYALGARHSHFSDPHGLPSVGKQYSSAYDMALIFREALKNDFIKQAITYKFHIIYSKDGRRIFLKSHNKSLFLNWKRDIYGKTGYTREAQSCFVGYIPKGDDILIVALFGCRKRWDDLKFIIEHYGGIDL